MTPDEPAGRFAPGAKITPAEWGLIMVLVAIQFTHMVDFVIIMPLGGRLMDEFQIGPDQFAWIVSAYALAAGMASLVGAAILDRFDRRQVLLVMYAGFVLGTLCMGWVGRFEYLLAARTLAGACGGLAAVALNTMIGDLFPPMKRGRASGAMISSFAVASILGLPIGLYLADLFGRGAPFFVLAGLSVAVWVLAWFRLPPVRAHLSAPRRHPLTEFVAVAREPNHVRAFAFSFFLVLGTFTVASFIGPVVKADNGWSERDLAQIYFWAGLCTLVAMTAIGRLTDRLPRRPLFRVLGSAALVMAVVVSNLPPGPLWVACAALSGFMASAAGRMAPAQAILLGAAEPRVRGAFMSLNTAVQHAATGLAPLIAGALLTKTDDGRLHGFWMVGLAAAGTAAVALVLVGFIRQNEQHTPAAVPPAPVTTPQPEPAAV